MENQRRNSLDFARCFQLVSEPVPGENQIDVAAEMLAAEITVESQVVVTKKVVVADLYWLRDSFVAEL